MTERQIENREKLLQSITETLQELNTDALQFIYKYSIEAVKDNERYSIHTTEERLEELKAADAARNKAYEEEQAAKQAELEKIKENRYNLNHSMIMLGKSHYWSYCCAGGEYSSFFEEVIKARPYETTLGAAMDIFSIGMICGIKEQRKRNKAKVCKKM